MEEFRAFWAATKGYAECTRPNTQIHRAIAGAVHKPSTTYEWAGKEPEREVLADIERSGILIFAGYDARDSKDINA